MSNIFQLNNNKTGAMSVFIVNLGHISHLCYVSSINFEQVHITSVSINKGYKNAHFYYFKGG